MPDSSQRPLLTIAIPTFNRAGELAGLLDVLLPQVKQFMHVEVLISDNASTDTTASVCETAASRWAAAGAHLRVRRHESNIGADANFASCYDSALGSFFWICGDDDRIVPGALAEVLQLLTTASGAPADVDLIYATSYGFHSDFMAERQSDPLHRRVHTMRDPRAFATTVNIMFTFISGIIVNKERLDSLPHEDPKAFVDTNLVQLSWSLPLLQHFRKGIVLWTRPVAAQLGNAHGYSLGRVFGVQLAAVTKRLLPERPDLAARILNPALRRWFPSIVIDLRGSGNKTLRLHEAHAELRSVFGRNPRYWLFTYPALTLPFPVAKLYTRVTAAVSKVLQVLHLPGFWRKET